MRHTFFPLSETKIVVSFGFLIPQMMEKRAEGYENRNFYIFNRSTGGTYERYCQMFCARTFLYLAAQQCKRKAQRIFLAITHVLLNAMSSLVNKQSFTSKVIDQLSLNIQMTD